LNYISGYLDNNTRVLYLSVSLEWLSDVISIWSRMDKVPKWGEEYWLDKKKPSGKNRGDYGKGYSLTVYYGCFKPEERRYSADLFPVP
jgi:hypothetical protein